MRAFRTISLLCITILRSQFPNIPSGDFVLLTSEELEKVD